MQAEWEDVLTFVPRRLGMPLYLAGLAGAATYFIVFDRAQMTLRFSEFGWGFIGFALLVAPLVLVALAITIRDLGRDILHVRRRTSVHRLPSGFVKGSLLVASLLAFGVATVCGVVLAATLSLAGLLPGPDTPVGPLSSPDAGVMFESDGVRVFSPGLAGMETIGGTLLFLVLVLLLVGLPIGGTVVAAYFVGSQVYEHLLFWVFSRWREKLSVDDSPDENALFGVVGFFGGVVGLAWYSVAYWS